MSIATTRRLRAALALGLSVIAAGAGAGAAAAAPSTEAAEVKRTLVERTAEPAGAAVEASGKIRKAAKRHAKAIKQAKKHPSRTRAAVGPNGDYNLGCVYTSTVLLCGNNWANYYPQWVHVEYVINGQDGAEWVSVADWNAIVAYLQNA